MKRNCRRLLVYALFSIAMSCLPTVLKAQPNPGDCNNQDPDAPPCPVDGGLCLLLTAGILYGAKKVKDHRNKKPVQLI